MTRGFTAAWSVRTGNVRPFNVLQSDVASTDRRLNYLQVRHRGWKNQGNTFNIVVSASLLIGMNVPIWVGVQP